jgi:hypothetical protein
VKFGFFISCVVCGKNKTFDRKFTNKDRLLIFTYINNSPMTEIILKDKIEQGKIDALLNFLKSLDIDAELRTIDVQKSTEAIAFSLAKGIWSNYEINSQELREKAWKR